MQALTFGPAAPSWPPRRQNPLPETAQPIGRSGGRLERPDGGGDAPLAEVRQQKGMSASRLRERASKRKPFPPTGLPPRAACVSESRPSGDSPLGTIMDTNALSVFVAIRSQGRLELCPFAFRSETVAGSFELRRRRKMLMRQGEIRASLPRTPSFRLTAKEVSRLIIKGPTRSSCTSTLARLST